MEKNSKLFQNVSFFNFMSGSLHKSSFKRGLFIKVMEVYLPLSLTLQRVLSRLNVPLKVLPSERERFIEK